MTPSQADPTPVCQNPDTALISAGDRHQFRHGMFAIALLLIVVSVMWQTARAFDGAIASQSMSSDMVSLAANQDESTCAILVQSLRLRRGPSTSSAPITSLASGTLLYPIGRNADSSWVNVIVATSGQRGWVASAAQYILCTDPVVNQPVTSGDAAAPASEPTPLPPPAVAQPAVIAQIPTTDPMVAFSPPTEASAAQGGPVQFSAVSARPTATFTPVPPRPLPEEDKIGGFPLYEADPAALATAAVMNAQRKSLEGKVLANDGSSTFVYPSNRLGIFSDSLVFQLDLSAYPAIKLIPQESVFTIFRTDYPGGPLQGIVFWGVNFAETGSPFCLDAVDNGVCRNVKLRAGELWPGSDTPVSNGYYAVLIDVSFENEFHEYEHVETVLDFAIASPLLAPLSFLNEINATLPAGSQIGVASPSDSVATLPLIAAPLAAPVAAASALPVTASDAMYFRGSATVSCVADGRVWFQGAVTHNGQPVNGAKIGFKSRLVEGTTPVVRPEQSGPSDLRPDWLDGYYEHSVDADASTAKDKHLEIWVIGSDGQRISDYVNWDTNGSTGPCNKAVINFTSP